MLQLGADDPEFGEKSVGFSAMKTPQQFLKKHRNVVAQRLSFSLDLAPRDIYISQTQGTTFFIKIFDKDEMANRTQVQRGVSSEFSRLETALI